MMKNNILGSVLTALLLSTTVSAKVVVPHGNNCDTKLLELPAYTTQKGSQVRYYQESDERQQPYFVLSFNTTYNIPDWVAWRLTKDHTDGTASRKECDFQPDLTIKNCPTKQSYNGVGTMTPKHSRGHFCPAADNKWSQDAMHDCFYMTNIAPQPQDMNSGTWGKLENLCRSWANKYGEIYIAAGPVIEKGMERLPFNKKIARPTRFYKVVLRKENGKYKAIGWIISAEGKCKVMSVDEVERITGLDFFHNLPDNIERQIEANYNLNDWQGAQRLNKNAIRK